MTLHQTNRFGVGGCQGAAIWLLACIGWLLEHLMVVTRVFWVAARLLLSGWYDILNDYYCMVAKLFTM